jgi:hypothetical protein
MKWYICWLVRYVRQLTNEHTGHIFVGLGTEEYISVIFLGIEEFKKTEECLLFSCSVSLAQVQITP